MVSFDSSFRPTEFQPDAGNDILHLSTETASFTTPASFDVLRETNATTPALETGLKVGTNTSFGAIENIYDRPLNERVVGIYNGRPVYDTGMKTGSDIGSGTANHMHFEVRPKGAISIVEMTERFTAIPLAYDAMGYKLRVPNFGNYFNPNDPLEKRVAWVQNTISKHTADLRPLSTIGL